MYIWNTLLGIIEDIKKNRMPARLVLDEVCRGDISKKLTCE
jgi:hypothetical protein